VRNSRSWIPAPCPGVDRGREEWGTPPCLRACRLANLDREECLRATHRRAHDRIPDQRGTTAGVRAG
jgi:hypothetical protein